MNDGQAWKEFLNSHGYMACIELASKLNIFDSKTLNIPTSDDSIRKIDLIKSDNFVQYEETETINDCQVIISFKHLKNEIFEMNFQTLIASDFLEPNNSNDNNFSSNVKIAEGCASIINSTNNGFYIKTIKSIGKDLNIRNVQWSNKNLEIYRKLDNKLIAKVEHKLWLMKDLTKVWGESYIFKCINDNWESESFEKWEDNFKFRMIDFWTIYKNNKTEVYSYGNKSGMDYDIKLNLSERLNLNVYDSLKWFEKWEKYDNYFYIDKYWLSKEKKWGKKEGREGIREFYENWEETQEVKIIKKWNIISHNGRKEKWGENITLKQSNYEEHEQWKEIEGGYKEGNYKEKYNKKYVRNHSDKFGENHYENSNKKIFNEIWNDINNHNYIKRFSDDGFGHKHTEIIGKGYQSSGKINYEFIDNFWENVSTGETITLKEWIDNLNQMKWKKKYINTKEFCMEDNYGKEALTNESWKEKWYDNKKGESWTEKEGQRGPELWREKWHQIMNFENKCKYICSCRKYRKLDEEEWEEEWNEENSESANLSKHCKKWYRMGNYSRCQIDSKTLLDLNSKKYLCH